MRILLASSIFPDTIKKLRERYDIVDAINANEEKLKLLIKNCEAIIFRSGINLSAGVMKCSPQLKLIIRAGSGFDNIDLNYVQKKRIQFSRIPGPGARAVAELAFGLMLAHTREILRADCMLRKGRWVKHEIKGYLLTKKTLGIVGVGNIGSCVGRLASVWGMNVIGCVKSPTPTRAKELLSSQGIRLTKFNEVISSADFVSVHVPFDNSTRNLFNQNVFYRMKPGAVLINLSRGGVVDELSLYRALTKDKILRGAALDVHEKEGDGHISPLAELTNVILTPHIGAQTIDSQKEIGQEIINILDTHVASLNGLEKKNVIPAKDFSSPYQYSPKY
jgi:phosphoglycerate dehydrogenase-like enzyme